MRDYSEFIQFVIEKTGLRRARSVAVWNADCIDERLSSFLVYRVP